MSGCMSKRTKVSARSRNVRRPCEDCIWFRWLDAGKRFGVCGKHEKPSDPRDCVVYKRKAVEEL